MIAPDDVRERTYVVVSHERRTETIAEIWLHPANDPLDYVSGQFALVEDADRSVPARSYSFANAARTDGAISFLISRVPNGATSTWVHDVLAVDDEVVLTGPYGCFVDDAPSGAPRLYVGAGSGLAPLRALVETVVPAARSPVTLMVFARTDADVIDGARFRQLEVDHPPFRFVPVLTRGEGASARGRIPAILQQARGELARHHVFIAGRASFVRGCAGAAAAAGVPAQDIHQEAFSVDW